MFHDQRLLVNVSPTIVSLKEKNDTCRKQTRTSYDEYMHMPLSFQCFEFNRKAIHVNGDLY